jgi:hypothetical protein
VVGGIISFSSVEILVPVPAGTGTVEIDSGSCLPHREWGT